MKKLKTWQLILGLLLVIGGTTLFVLALSGVFDDNRAVIDAEYYSCSDNCESRYMELEASEYEKLIMEGKSFVVFVDQGGCVTADKLRSFVNSWAAQKGLKIYRMMFEEMKKTSLHDFVKYYPSVAVVSHGKVLSYLRADSDDDASAYNEYGAFENWVKKYLK